MSPQNQSSDAHESGWLMRYYATRAGVSAAWVAAAFAVGSAVSPMAGALLVVYPAWDAAANLWDASRNGGLRANLPQAFNTAFSAAVAVIVTAALGTATVFYAFGVWAAVAGLLQLATAVRRWKGFSAQWPMILSGAQSALAGLYFIQRGIAGAVPAPNLVAPYAAFGAVYFAISAAVLLLAALRQRRSAATL